MNPVVGLDISKEESHGQAFLARGKPFIGTFHFEHKVKTDAADAYLLGELYYREEFEPFKKRGVQLLNLRYLTRQYESLSMMCVQTKLQFQAVLDQVFPGYKGVFGAMYSGVSLRFLSEFPTSYSVLQTDEDALRAKMKELLSSKRWRSEDWINQRVQRLVDAEKQNPFQQTMYASHLINLKVLITLILQYQGHLAELEQNIDALAEEIEEYELIQSIPGIGHKIGEVDRFDHPKKLVAFAGIDPSVFASGKFTATRNRITKRGSRQLRYALVMAVQCGLIRSRNMRIKALYERKRAEGKPHKVALIACANKLVHWLYAILKNKKEFRPI